MYTINHKQRSAIPKSDISQKSPLYVKEDHYLTDSGALILDLCACNLASSIKKK